MPADDQTPAAHVTANGYRSHAYYLPTALHERLKAAWWATKDEPAPDGEPSLATKVARLFEEEAERLEQKFNGGEPFPPAPRRARGVDPEASRRQGEFMTGVWSKSRDQRQQ